ncbi:MAG: hypothetical protein PWQ27_1548 [Kosmotoga sp.]|nr:hypothetical protein [Kosmotoga sp.]
METSLLTVSISIGFHVFGKNHSGMNGLTAMRLADAVS